MAVERNQEMDLAPRLIRQATQTGNQCINLSPRLRLPITDFFWRIEGGKRDLRRSATVIALFPVVALSLVVARSTIFPRKSLPRSAGKQIEHLPPNVSSFQSCFHFPEHSDKIGKLPTLSNRTRRLAAFHRRAKKAEVETAVQGYTSFQAPLCLPNIVSSANARLDV
jgi:hypothetical protein